MPSRLSLSLTLTLLLTSFFTSLTPAAPASAERQGDWFITTAETIKDQSLRINGSITIRDGGFLTLTHFQDKGDIRSATDGGPITLTP